MSYCYRCGRYRGCCHDALLLLSPAVGEPEVVGACVGSVGVRCSTMVVCGAAGV